MLHAVIQEYFIYKNCEVQDLAVQQTYSFKLVTRKYFLFYIPSMNAKFKSKINTNICDIYEPKLHL